MLSDDDVVAHRQAKPCTFARGLGREEWIEYFLFYLVRDARAVIANTDFNLVSKILRHSGKRRFETFTGLRFSFRRGVEPVRYDIEQDASDLLGIDVSHADGRIEIALEGDTEACLFCPGTVIGQVQALI